MNLKTKWLTNKEHNYLLPFVIIVTAVAALWLLFFAHNSVLHWMKAAVEVQEQEKEIDRLNREIKEMDGRIEDLSHNRDSAEAFARETYHFCAPGEDVYIAR